MLILAFVYQDIFSYNVEQSRGDNHNMITVIMNQQSLSLQEAIDSVSDLCKDTINAFEFTRRSLPSWGPDLDRQVQLYIDGLQNWIIGSLHWSFETRRYFGDQGQEIKKQLVMKLLPKKNTEACFSDSPRATLDVQYSF